MSAESIIKKKGRDVVLITTSTSGDDWNPTISTSEETIKAVGLDFKSEDVDGTLVRKNDIMFLTAHSTKIGIEDKIRDGSDTYSIVRNEVFQPGDDIVFQKAHCRL